MRKRFLLSLLVLSLIALFSGCEFLFTQVDAPTVIFVIGDGMGQSHIDAASHYLEGETGFLSFESFPVRGTVTTYSADNAVTDSAAAATALATGYKVGNGVVSTLIPGSGNKLTTLIEYYKAHNLRTGAVTTTAVTHATPAAFLSHVPNRNLYGGIADQIFNITRPDLIMGGARDGYGVTESLVTGAGYALLDGLTDVPVDTPVAYLAGDGHLPYEYDVLESETGLSEMVGAALSYFGDDEPFFLLVEAGRIDHAAHSNDLARMIGEVAELSGTVDMILQWASGREDVLVIVTADHETGGLSVTGNGEGVLPDAVWGTTGHTAAPVPYFIRGERASEFSLITDNTQFFQKIVSFFD